jgi:hypothetical protein
VQTLHYADAPDQACFCTRAGTLTAACARLGPLTSAAHHVMISVYMVLCMCGDAVSQAAQSFLPGVVRPSAAQTQFTVALHAAVHGRLCSEQQSLVS